MNREFWTAPRHEGDVFGEVVQTSAPAAEAPHRSAFDGAFSACGQTSTSGSFADPTETSARSELTLERLQSVCRQVDWNPDPKALLSSRSAGSAVGVEQFLSLRSFLYLEREHRPLRKLLISSSMPGEGKTFTALNLAYALARQPEQTTLLIDSDLRLPKLHRALGTTSSPGLTDYLNSQVDEFSILQRGSSPNFFFIPVGNPASNVAELIGNGRLKLLLDRMSYAMDWIILDSPPVLPVSDAKLMAEVCDAVLFVVRAGATPYDVAQKGRRQFRDQQLLAAVLNDATPNKVHGYYDGYRYAGYGAGDGTGKGSERRPPLLRSGHRSPADGRGAAEKERR